MTFGSLNCSTNKELSLHLFNFTSERVTPIFNQFSFTDVSFRLVLTTTFPVLDFALTDRDIARLSAVWSYVFALAFPTTPSPMLAGKITTRKTGIPWKSQTKLITVGFRQPANSPINYWDSTTKPVHKRSCLKTKIVFCGILIIAFNDSIEWFQFFCVFCRYLRNDIDAVVDKFDAILVSCRLLRWMVSMTLCMEVVELPMITSPWFKLCLSQLVSPLQLLS